jgi:mannose/fructose/N-acetylgalactosamine-specific phosphotransferase system component IID
MAVFTSNSFGSLLSSALKYTLGAGVVAALINTILLTAARIPAAELLVQRGTQTEQIGFSQVILASIMPALIAGLVFAVIAKYLPKPFLYFNIIAALVFILAFFSPLNNLINASNKAVILLEIMHVVVGSAVLYSLNNLWGAPQKD